MFKINNITDKVRKYVKEHAKQQVIKITMGSAGFLVMIGGASAEGNIINVTQITGMLADVGAIFPSFGTLVIAVVPTLMVLGIVGFVMGFFDKILSLFDRVF